LQSAGSSDASATQG